MPSREVLPAKEHKEQEQARIALIINGDPNVRDLYATQITHMEGILPVQVLKASGLTEAREQIMQIPEAQRTSLVIILDPNLPSESGIELLEERRQENSWLAHIPIHIIGPTGMIPHEEVIYLGLGVESVWHNLSLADLKRIITHPKVRRPEKAS